MKEATTASEPARLRLLGRFRLKTASGVAVDLPVRRGRGLLAFLALTADHVASREQLCGLLWSERGETQARASLRQCLLDLRGALAESGLDLLDIQREAVGLKRGAMLTDCDKVEAALREDVETLLARLNAMGAHRLLDDLEIDGLFQDWREETRARFDRVVATAVATRLSALEAQGDWVKARMLADAYLPRDRLDETVVATAIRAEIALGATGAAHRRFQLLESALFKELGVSPGAVAREALNTTAARLSRADERPASSGASPTSLAREGTAGSRPSLAVLPFTNLSRLPEDEVFAFGMVEDIIDALSRGVEVRVLASSATARFRIDGVTDLKSMARELSVRYALEGNVRRVGETLRVSTQLVETDSGRVAWSQRFDRPIAQLAELQEALVMEVAARLRTQAHRLEIERALRKVGDITAWEANMRSMAAFRKMTATSFLTAIAEAKRAVELAPDYGSAVGLLSQTQAVLYNQTMADDPVEVARIRALAERAIALEPDGSVVLSSASLAFSMVGFPSEGLEVGQRAVNQNPTNEFAHAACGMACTLLDRCEEAIAYYDEELRLAPDHPVIWISHGWRACAQIRAGRWDEAAAAYHLALRMTPDNAAPHIGLAVCHRQLGRPDAGLACMAQARKLEPDSPLSLWKLRYGRAFAGSSRREVFLGHMSELWKQAVSEAQFDGPSLFEKTRSAV